MVLFSETGGGHRAAALSLARALREIVPEVRVDLCDPLIGEGAPVVRQLASLYPRIIKRSPATWGAIYHVANLRPAFATLRLTFGPQVRRKLDLKLEISDPDVVLSVHPLLNHVAAAAIAGSQRRRGLMTVITDLVDCHRGWTLPEADLVVVATVQACSAVLRGGVPEERVRVLGLPVDLRCRPPEPGEKAALRRRLGLREDRPTVLVLGGGEGSGHLLRQVRALAWEANRWQVVVVCGRNEKLRQRLSRPSFRTPLVVLGFVRNMPELLRAADLAVTKAGPGTIAEALASGVPLVLTGYLPGQETANVDLVCRSGLGVYAPRPEALRGLVQGLLAGGTVAHGLAKRAAGFARPGASLDIARECLALAERYRAAEHASR